MKDKQGRTPVEMALGVGLHGHAGGPPTVREGTANLLRQLMSGNQSRSAAITGGVMRFLSAILLAGLASRRSALLLKRPSERPWWAC